MSDGAVTGRAQVPQRCDLVIAGGGVVGLWLAWFAVKAGLDVLVADSRHVGAGASGGVLGALMPHMPERWNPKKEFQYQALVQLPAFLEEIRQSNGCEIGYHRCGRILPLTQPHHRDLSLERQAEAERRWRSDETGLSWSLLETSVRPGWPAASAAPHGFVLETLAARIDPRGLLAALRDALNQSRRATIAEGVGVTGWSGGRAQLSSGDVVSAAKLAVAAGHESFPFLANFQEPAPMRPLGRGVKGQAALLKADVDPLLPLIFHDGVYIVPHAGGRVAIGSTSEDTFDDPHSTDWRVEELIARAVGLVPELGRTPVIERWAGLRPRAIGRDPMVGPVGDGSVIAVTGGFKITFGIAHRLAQCALAPLLGQSGPDLPDSFRADVHLRKAGSAPVV